MTRTRVATRRPHHHARSERRAGRREELLEAAVACIRREGAGASMDQIAAEAGVTKPVVYRFFRDKGDLYEAIATRYVEAVATELRAAWGGAGEPRELLRAGIDTYLRLVEEEPEIYRFLMRRARVEQAAATTAIDDFIRRLGGELGLLVGEQLAAAGLDTGGAEAWSHAIVGMVAGAADWWVDRRTMSRQRLVAYLGDLLWNGFDGAAAAGARA